QKDAPPEMEHPPLLDFGLEHGDTKIEDLTDDKEVDLPANISYFGSSYKQLYISVDGLISFQKGMRYFKSITWKEGTRNENTDKPFLAPFMYDGFKAINLQQGIYKGNIFFRVMEKGQLQIGSKNYHEQTTTLNWLSKYVKDSTLNAPEDFEANLVVVVTWENVDTESADLADIRACSADSNKCKTGTFQVVLVSDKNLGRTVAILNYLKIDIPMKSSYQAGFNGGYGRDWLNVIPCHGPCGEMEIDLSLLPTYKGSDLVGRFILDVGGETVIRGGCLPDEFASGILEVYPSEVGMFGGEKLEVSGKCLPTSTPIYCRFGDSDTSPVVEGIMLNTMKGYCPVPTLTTLGEIILAWSPEKNPGKWHNDRTISVVHPGRMEPVVSVPQSIKDAWYSRDASEITVIWDPKKFTHVIGKVDIRLIGYRETSDKVEYKLLRDIGRADISNGRFTFRVVDHRCTTNCLEFEQGLLEVSLPPEYLGAANERVAIRYGTIPLGWYVNEKMTEDNSSDWSDQMCKAWFNEDAKKMDWLDSLLPCPCTLDQALADFGRFQPDAGCNVFDGSKCTYHKEAKHCVRAIVPTEEGAGNQCCYSSSNQLLYSQLSYQGSTPDRSHDWGAAPYGEPDRVPSLSHWKHDVVSFYYCCLWNEYELCDLYMEQRPTKDCKDYNVPAIATIRGVSHVTTFDGRSYQVAAEGDFYLLLSKDIMIQGRFGERRNAWDFGTLSVGTKSWSAPVLRSVGISHKNVFMDVYLAPENADPPRGLEIRVKGERRFFDSKSTMWQDFDGLSIVNNALPGSVNEHNNFTIMTSSNVGINVLALNGLLHLTVALPPEMKQPEGVREGMGLLGTYDNNPGNDYTTRNGLIIAPGTDLSKFLDNFVLDWKVEEERNSLFPFFKGATKTSPEFLYSTYDDIPTNFQEAPTSEDVESVCGDDQSCKWDYRITGSAKVAKATKEADELYEYIQASIQQQDSCGLPEVGRNAVMDTYDFSEGSRITVTGCGEGMSFSGSKEFECVKEPRSEAERLDRADYGLVKTDEGDGVEYIIHWLPKPSTLCTDGSSSTLDLMWIIIIAVAAVVLLIVIAIIIFIVVRRRKSKDKYSSSSRPTPANRRSGGNDYDEKSGQAMLPRDVDRSPVYKPSRDPVQMQGSTV
ncbi:sushi domain-containing protein 2-like, partial [Plakobranchus ocellatus]